MTSIQYGSPRLRPSLAGTLPEEGCGTAPSEFTFPAEKTPPTATRYPEQGTSID